MPLAEIPADDEDARRVDGPAIRERAVLAFEGRVQRGAVAERFFLRERAAQEAPAGVVAVGHVEDAGWFGVGVGVGVGFGDVVEGDGEREGGVDAVGVEDADAGGVLAVVVALGWRAGWGGEGRCVGRGREVASRLGVRAAGEDAGEEGEGFLGGFS